MTIFTGSATALVTPFNENGVNFDAFKNNNQCYYTHYNHITPLKRFRFIVILLFSKKMHTILLLLV